MKIMEKMKIHEVNPHLHDWLFRATNVWGVQAQIDLLMEEMSELNIALLKERRIIPLNPENTNDYKTHIAEEIADVQMMLIQLMFIYGNHSLVEDFMSAKFDRLKKKVIKGEEEKAKEIQLLLKSTKDDE